MHLVGVIEEMVEHVRVVFYVKLKSSAQRTASYSHNTLCFVKSPMVVYFFFSKFL